MPLLQKDQLPDHAFWRFILKTYENEPARKTLVQIQQLAAVQINLLLFCCWFAQAGQGRLTRQDIQELIVATAPWHERIILSLQKLQQQTAASLFGDLDQEVQTELQFANHIEQLMLIDVPIRFTRNSRTPIQKLTDACKNIAMYCKTAQIFLSNTSCENVFHLLAAIFPKLDLLEVQKTSKAILLTEAAQPSAQGKLILD